MFYNLFIKNHEAVIISDNDTTFEVEQKLLKRGFQYVWDSAPTYETAKDYAQNFYKAYTKEDAPYGICRICENVPALSLAKGSIYIPEAQLRPRPYKGYICEQCGEMIDNIQWH